MDFDVAVIGGGLAGLALSIQAAAAGYATVLFEKEQYPFHKVCGEYISMESYGFLEQLGVPLTEMSLPRIQHLALSDQQGRVYTFKLPLGGFGVSRYTLDDRLYRIALEKGVTVHTGVKVGSVAPDGNRFVVSSTAGQITAAVVAGSYGKRSNLDVRWKRPFTQQKPNKLNHYIGIKYHIRYPHAADTIALHNFKDGYCGMSAIEDGKTCLCYLTTAANLAASGHSVARMEAAILQRHPQLQDIFSRATFLYPEPLAISQVSFARKTQVENGVLMLGDAAGMITPLCGNGMSMALHGSKLAWTEIRHFLEKQTSRSQMEQQYTRKWQQQFARRLWMGRQVQQLFGGQTSTALFLRTMYAVPAIATAVIRSTHGSPF